MEPQERFDLAPSGDKPDPGGRGSKSGRQGAIWIGSSVAKNYPQRELRGPLGWSLRQAGREFIKVATAGGGGIAGFPPFDALLEAIPSFLAAFGTSPKRGPGLLPEKMLVGPTAGRVCIPPVESFRSATNRCFPHVPMFSSRI